MGAFTVCWLPFFILALIKPFCANPKTCIPHELNSLFLWLGYANSFLNPIIYARFNRDFRTPFKEILLCRCRGIDRRLRSESYVEQFGAAGGSSASALPLHQQHSNHLQHRSSVGFPTSGDERKPHLPLGKTPSFVLTAASDDADTAAPINDGQTPNVEFALELPQPDLVPQQQQQQQQQRCSAVTPSTEASKDSTSFTVGASIHNGIG
jgi:hypothetical protein